MYFKIIEFEFKYFRLIEFDVSCCYRVSTIFFIEFGKVKNLSSLKLFILDIEFEVFLIEFELFFSLSSLMNIKDYRVLKLFLALSSLEQK